MRPTIVSYVGALSLVAAACGGTSSPVVDSAALDAGRDGGAGAAGAGGVAGSGADARVDAPLGPNDGPSSSEVGATDAERAPALGGCLGLCLESLTAPCPKVVGCTSSMVGGVTTICYANGVKEQRVVDGNMLDGTVKNVDGSLCYRYTRTSTTQDFLDLTGKPIASVENGPTNTLFSVTCGTEVMRPVDLSTSDCGETLAVATQSCAAGACTF